MREIVNNVRDEDKKRFDTVLILSRKHVKENVSNFHKYGQMNKAVKKVKRKIRLIVLPVALKCIKIVCESLDWSKVLNSMQFFKVITKIEQFQLNETVNVAPLMMVHPIMMPQPP